MTRFVITALLLIVISTLMVVSGCDKERIVESTIHETEYIELPPDTVFQVDTVYTTDSITIHATDTVTQFDTVFIHDTVLNNQCEPNEYLALIALQYYSDPIVFDYINTHYGISGGWVLYLSAFQTQLTQKSAGVYDIYGYIDYWTPEWDGFEAFEYYWRMTYTGGDPADPNNWDISEPPAMVSGVRPGVHTTGSPGELRSTRR